MNDSPPLDDLVCRWLELRDGGAAPSPEELCDGRPELVEELKRRLRALAEMESFLGAGDESVPDPPPGPVAPGAVPGYELLGVLGRGGMGVVYRARQLSLNRVVALKMILAQAHAGAEDRARLRAEAEAVARLQHPNIVQIHDVGEHQGLPFFSMEFLGGGSLAGLLEAGPLPPRQAAELVWTLAGAVHYAHQRGVVHRDLKPGNILLASLSGGREPPEAALQGTDAPRSGGSRPPLRDFIPKITDFGLAKCLDDKSGRTRTGEVLGTPSYMAPEQAAGKTREVGPLADVYALGAILYECLTGRPPFRGGTYVATINQVLTEEPAAPSSLRPNLPRDLQTVCLTCLHKDPARRYPDANALAEDLQAFLGGQPIRVRPPGPWESLRRWVRRRPWQAALVAGAAISVPALLLGLFWDDALAVAAVALLLFLIVGGWYSARLQTALRTLDRQHAAAERNLERMHLLLETTRRLVTVTDHGELLRLLGETTARLCDAERATIFLIDWQRGELWSRMMLVDEGEIRVPLGVGVAGAAAVTGETLNVPDAYADPRFNPEVDRRTGFRTRNLFTVPMRGRDGQVLGVFQVVNKRQGPFTHEDAEILNTLAASSALAVERGK